MNWPTLVLQLERLGDLVQTTPLIDRLARKGPVEVVALENAASVLEGMPAVRAVHTLSAERVVAFERVLAAPEGEPVNLEGEAIRRAGAALLADLPAGPFGLVVNACHKKSAAWLASRLPARERRGGLFTAHGALGYRADPFVFLHAILGHQRWNRWNLVDLMRALEPGQTDGLDRLHAARAVDSGFPLPEGRLVAINPGASRADRRWPAEAFARLCIGLSASGFTPVLVGGPADRELAREVADGAGGRVVDRCGANSVAEMRHFFEHCAAVVTNDTAAAHLAAAAGAPTVAIHAPHGARVTGAWASGNVLVEPVASDDRALDRLEVAPVLTAAVALADGRDPARLARAPETRGARLWRTWLDEPSAEDPIGGLRLQSLREGEATATEERAQAVRSAWSRLFARTLTGGGQDAHGRRYLDLASRVRVAIMDPDLDALEAIDREVRQLIADAQRRPDDPTVSYEAFLDWGLRLLVESDTARLLGETARLLEATAALHHACLVASDGVRNEAT